MILGITMQNLRTRLDKLAHRLTLRDITKPWVMVEVHGDAAQQQAQVDAARLAHPEARLIVVHVPTKAEP
jgi:hypothetical protein